MSEVKFIARDPNKCYHYPDCWTCESHQYGTKRWSEFETEEESA